MATVSWSNAVHIECLGNTLCGRDIPSRKEWNVFGIPTCKACLKAEMKAKAQVEYEERHIIGQCPFNPKKTFTVNPVNKDEFTIFQYIDGVYQSETTANLYRTSEVAYIDQEKLIELAS